MNPVVLFSGICVLLLALVVVSKVRVSDAVEIAFSALVYTGLGTFVWFVIWASGAGVVTASIVAGLMLASFVPTFEWMKRRS